jgi:hypothetical protein
MPNDGWLEYGAPGTAVLTPKDVERAQEQLEKMWRDALRRAREVESKRERCDKRAS